ncbi:MAG: flagellar basal-body rod protein FlgF [Alphaproteobacteria bacterium]|nr:flagellar basal-body rod protein FlgF [Alphaproteobacteria bacterium]
MDPFLHGLRRTLLGATRAMDNTLMIAMQTQRVLQRRMDVTANNLANMSTSGFKADSLLAEAYSADPAKSAEKPFDIRFVRDVGLMRDLSQGPLRQTGNPFDIAIQGDGFFAVQGANGQTQYTRDGALQINGAGQIVTAQGLPVLGPGGAPVTIQTQGETPSIAADGTIRIGENALGQIGVFSFGDPEALKKMGDNLFIPDGQPTIPFTGEVIQGALEESNVRPVIELTRLIEISRAYESAGRFMSQGQDLRQRTIERLGRA